MSKSIKMGYNFLICEGDVMNVILPLWKHTSLPDQSIEHLIEEARIILRSFSSWFVNRMSREANFVANNIAI